MAAKKKVAKRPVKKAARKPARKAAPKKVSAVPALYGSITAALVFKDSRPALEWYGNVFGGKVITRMEMPGGRIMHAEMKIGDAIIMLGDESKEMGIQSAESLGGSAVGMMHYVKDCDAVFARAVAAGAKVKMPLADMFWGDRFGEVVDPFGHRWAIATHKKDLSPKAMAAAAEAAMKEMMAGPPPDANGMGGPPA